MKRMRNEVNGLLCGIPRVLAGKFLTMTGLRLDKARRFGDLGSRRTVELLGELQASCRDSANTGDL